MACSGTALPFTDVAEHGYWKLPFCSWLLSLQCVRQSYVQFTQSPYRRIFLNKSKLPVTGQKGMPSDMELLEEIHGTPLSSSLCFWEHRYRQKRSSWQYHSRGYWCYSIKRNVFCRVVPYLAQMIQIKRRLAIFSSFFFETDTQSSWKRKTRCRCVCK
jgi:hypothetical protein